MNNTRSWFGHLNHAWRMGVLSLAASMALHAQPPLQAAAIKSVKTQRVRAANAQVSTYWNNYFAKALAEKRLTIHGLKAILVLKPAADGSLPNIPMVAYLQWRRSLNPVRFRQYHPLLTRWLERDEIIKSTPPPPPPPPVPGGVNPPQVPEPHSALIAAMLLVTGICARRWSAKHRDASITH